MRAALRCAADWRCRDRKLSKNRSSSSHRIGTPRQQSHTTSNRGAEVGTCRGSACSTANELTKAPPSKLRQCWRRRVTLATCASLRSEMSRSPSCASSAEVSGGRSDGGCGGCVVGEGSAGSDGGGGGGGGGFLEGSDDGGGLRVCSAMRASAASVCIGLIRCCFQKLLRNDLSAPADNGLPLQTPHRTRQVSPSRKTCQAMHHSAWRWESRREGGAAGGGALGKGSGNSGAPGKGGSGSGAPPGKGVTLAAAAHMERMSCQAPFELGLDALLHNLQAFELGRRQHHTSLHSRCAGRWQHAPGEKRWKFAAA